MAIDKTNTKESFLGEISKLRSAAYGTITNDTCFDLRVMTNIPKTKCIFCEGLPWELWQYAPVDSRERPLSRTTERRTKNYVGYHNYQSSVL